MLGLHFARFAPTTHVFHYRRGRLAAQGAGLAFFYFAPVSTIIAVPLASKDLPFAFDQTTLDFQSLTIQGQVTYRVSDPQRLAAALDYSVDDQGRYVSEDPEHLEERLIAAAQVLGQSAVGGLTLKEALCAAPRLAGAILEGLRNGEAAMLLGVEILGLSIVAVRPSPEMSKALEAQAREDLQKSADEAIYMRRNAAVEQERLIRENELSTEVAVEEKKREIREKRMAADIAVEEQRAVLMTRRIKTDRQEAQGRAFALEVITKPLQGIDWRILMTAVSGGMKPEHVIAMAFRDLADNAQKIGELNIGPDVMTTLLGKGKA